ncbi:MAG: bifunctional 23S rRNA (guanine(2069)-N(7))-methyltransferase RlmK/23S rRNA (guanine(2445)-N(2))-methyltransferase RlmL [Pseudomonadota bacterium]|nr:bifunctional 23S rRNA (guanine(2069)-N(7))-methyltransferase RlmK/23S rRNA (guanine(2445)-N(2))-methyltransferase RlmL [Pseudomonadota bacterium]
MTTNTRLHTYWITCADGLEALLTDELTELGAQIEQRVQGRIVVTGSLETAYRICLWSRLASRVLLPIHTHTLPEQRTGDVRDVAEEIYEGAANFDWSLVFNVGCTFAIRLQTERGVKVNTQFATLRAKDGVVDAFMDSQGRRPSIDTKQPEITLTVLAGVGSHTYSLDLSGDSLHRRGYRQIMTDAPLKENLAAAILRLAGWHQRAFDVLIDPMCGSGTFMIEALLMRTDRAAGLNRRFGFMGWSGHDAALWQQLKQEAEQRHQAGLQQPLPRVYAYDANWNAVKATRHNLLAAGLEAALPQIQIEERTLADWPDFALQPEQQVLLIANPPYGERLGEKTQNRALYQGLGLRMQQALAGQQAAIIAAHIEQADVLPIQAHSTTRLMNGNLPIYVRTGQILAINKAANFLQHWHSQPVEIEGAQDFANRLQKNFSNFKKIALREGVTNLRIYDADLPDFNVAVDLYGDLLHVQEYAPPKTIDPDKAKARFNLALQAVRQVLGVQREQVFIKTRARQKGNAQYEKKGESGKRYIVQEAKARFYINMTDYLDTGLFLDHRPMRLKLAAEARGRHMLNLYAYTCTASVQAALGGAASTTSVDLSNTYLDWGKDNFVLNGLTVDHPDQQHQFFAADVFEWLKEGSEQYDLIFIDPPTFSNSKKFFGTFDVQRDHLSLIKRAMNRLTTDGVLYFSNNFRKFELDPELAERFSIQDISPQTIGFDFKRNTGIHRAWRIQHRQ